MAIKCNFCLKTIEAPLDATLGDGETSRRRAPIV
jgi:hypothetical protein